MLYTLPDSLTRDRYLFRKQVKLEPPKIDLSIENKMLKYAPYFGYEGNVDYSAFSRAECPKYNIWNTPMFYLNTSASDIPECSSSFSDSNNNSNSDENLLSTPLNSETPSSNDDMSISPLSSNDETNADLFQDYENRILPSMELIVPHKRLDVSPSCFLNGCVCGHHFEFRDMAYESRKRRNTRSSGVTIRPKIPPITAKLRQG